jgi:hypothetical protein
VLADKGYTGAGVGIHVPVKHQPDGPLHTDNLRYNQLVTALRAHRARQCLARSLARPRPGHHPPQRISAIAVAALVLASIPTESGERTSGDLVR